MRLKVKELIARAYEAAPRLRDADAALMKELAARLDVTYVALSEALERSHQLEHENANLLSFINTECFVKDGAEYDYASTRLPLTPATDKHIAEPEAQTLTIDQMRSFITDVDLAALHRFAECCDDPESGGHDLEKEQVARLEKIGALQRSGRVSYITDFGDHLISITAGIKLQVEGE
ncbi:hypothetical protein [Superficieibacter sp.]|uniref:hypothetical protein n=1 Tax=Superficieibacter sp. TaxID=2303322 RepID=UPI0028AF5B29|nr:hypothetical protein [Superficieibacter sp.]